MSLHWLMDILGAGGGVAFARSLFEVFQSATLERAIGAVSLSRPIMAALEAAMTVRPDGTAKPVERLGSGGWPRRLSRSRSMPRGWVVT